MTRRHNSRRVSRYSPHASSDGISGATRSPSRSPSPEKPASHGFLSEAYKRKYCRGKKGYRGGGGSRGGRGSSGAVGGSSGGERVGGGGRGPDGGRGRGSDGGRGRGSDGGRGRGPDGGRGRGSGGSGGGGRGSGGRGRGAIQNSPSTANNRWGNSPFSIFANQLQFQRNKERKERAGRPVPPQQQNFRRSRNDRKINPRDISKILKRFTEDDSSGSEQHDPDEGGIASTLFSLKNIPVRTEEEIDSVDRLRKKNGYPGKVEICFGKGSHQYERLKAHALRKGVPVKRLQ